jgi:MFS family permease
VIGETGSGIRRGLAELWHDGKGWVLLVVSVGWFFSIGTRFAYPTLLPFFREAFGISLSVAGLLVSVLWMAYAIGQFPGGILGDRFGEGNVLVASTVLSVIGITAVALSSTVYVLFAGTVAFGLATALYGPTRFTIFTDIYSERSGTAIGVTMAAGSVGNTVLPVLAGVIASYASWRLGFGALVPVFVVIAVALWIAVPGRTSPPMNDGGSFSLGTIRRIVAATRRRGLPVVLSVQVFAGFVNQGFLGLYPTYLVEVKGFSPSVAATLFGLYFAIGVVVQPTAGASRDQFGTKTTLVVLLGMYSAGLLLLPFVHGVVALGLLTVLLTARSGVGVINNTFISASLPEEIKGSGLGLLRTVWILAGATSPFVVGFLGDAGYFEEAFLLLALLAGIATALALFVPDR